jgi:hypothetical protein
MAEFCNAYPWASGGFVGVFIQHPADPVEPNSIRETELRRYGKQAAHGPLMAVPWFDWWRGRKDIRDPAVYSLTIRHKS